MRNGIGRFTMVTVVALMVVVGCGSRRPVVYPNEVAQEVGPAGVEADINECLRRAEEFTSGSSASGEVAGNAAGRAAMGAGVGAAAGAAGGAIYGDAGRGAASGAAGGAAAGLLSAMFDGMRRSEPDPVVSNFVTRCLSEKGYQVIGWE